MSTSVGVETFTETRQRGIDLFDPVHMFLVVFHRVNAVERERREKRGSHHRLPHPGHRRGHLIPQEMPPQSGLGALGVFEFHDPDPLDRLFPHPEKPGGDLGDHMIIVGPRGIRGYPPSPVQVKVSQASAARTRASMVWLLTDPKDIPPP